jgi:hypothetical protein
LSEFNSLKQIFIDEFLSLQTDHDKSLFQVYREVTIRWLLGQRRVVEENERDFVARKFALIQIDLLLMEVNRF